MGREITFYPEAERNRDLMYSEYTSCDRSCHVLIQGNGVEKYRFLLDAYRDVVAHYLSFDPIESPVVFLRRVAEQLESHADNCRFPLDDFKTVGIYVLLRAADAYYLLVSREDHIYLHEPDRFTPLRERSRGVDAIQLTDRDVQEELFPQRVTDNMSLFRMDAHVLDGADLVIGCGEEDKSTVVETLSDPMGMAAMEAENTRRKAVSSRFITRKVMAVGLDAEGMSAVSDNARPERIGKNRGASKRLLVVTSFAVLVLAAALWARSAWLPDLDDHQAAGRLGPSVEPQMDEVVTKDVPARETEAAQIEAESAPTSAAVNLTADLRDDWSIEFSSPVTSSPAIYENTVVFGCRDSSVYAVDRESGKTKWRYRTADGVGASPAVMDDIVIGADYRGNVFGLHADSGEQKWTSRLPAKVVSSPCVADSRALVGCYDGVVYCLDGRSGEQLWKTSCGSRVRANVATDGLRFFVPSYDGKLYALSCETGRELWSYGVGGNLSGGAVQVDGTIYIGGPDGRLHAVDTKTGKPNWTTTLGGALKSSVTVGVGRVFVGSNDRNVYCVDATSGELVWQYRTGGIVLASPRLSEGVLFVGSYDGVLYCLEASTGKLLGKVDSRGEIYSSPVVDHDNVYFGNNNGRFLRVVYR